MVKGSEKWGKDEQNNVKEAICHKEVMPLMIGMETATYNGDSESDLEYVQKVFLSLRDGQTGLILRQVLKNFDKSLHSASQDEVNNKIFHIIQIQKESGKEHDFKV